MLGKIVVGTWPLSGDFGARSPSEAEAVLNAAYEAGIRRFDVAPNYGLGYAESLIGMVFAGVNDIEIYTKAGNRPFSGKDFCSDAIIESVEQSLKRLRRDSIEGVFLHNPREEAGDCSEALQALDALKKAGKISKAGISGAKGYDYSHAPVNLIDIFQQDANLLYLNELQGAPSGTLFFARSPLATGILSGRLSMDTVFPFDDHRSGWLKGDRLASMMGRLDAIQKVLPPDTSLHSAARRFLLGRDDIHHIVCGVNNVCHIDDIVDDCVAGPLPAELINKLQLLHDTDFERPRAEARLGY